ncbi:unnamed protein product, partial [Brassica napus]
KIKKKEGITFQRGDKLFLSLSRIKKLKRKNRKEKMKSKKKDERIKCCKH